MILRLLTATSSILVTQLILLMLFTGIGLLVRRRYGLLTVSLEDALRTFWVGFGLVLLLLLIWNYFRPIDGATLVFVIAVGAVGLLRSRRDFAIDRRELIQLGLIMVPVGLWMAGVSLDSLQNWDDGLYHLQGVRWIEERRVAPGLANLFGPLGFNNTSFLYSALLETGPWQDRSYHIANGLLVFVLVAQSVRAGVSLLSPEHGGRRRHVFDLVLLAPAIALVRPEGIASYVTDTPTTMVVLAALSAWFALITRERPSPADENERGWLVVVVGTLLATAVCLKQNAAVLAATALPLAFASWVVGWRPDRSTVVRTGRFASTLVLGLGLCWMTRGILLSGYPLFPQTIAPFPVAWRVPVEHTEAELAYAIHSARADTEALSLPGAHRLFSWWPHWLSSSAPKLYEVWVPCGLILLGLLVIAAARLRSPTGSAYGPRAALRWMMPPITAAALAWFVVAPAPRYGMFLLWGGAALIVAEAFGRILATGTVPRRATSRVLAGTVVALACSAPLVQPVLRARGEMSVIGAMARANLNRPGDSLLEGLPPSPPLSTYVTASGLRLLVPEGRCFAAPLPCTSNPAPNLEQRDFGWLGSGFVVAGDWNMRDWPYAWRPDFLREWRRYREGVGGSR